MMKKLKSVLFLRERCVFLVLFTILVLFTYFNSYQNFVSCPEDSDIWYHANWAKELFSGEVQIPYPIWHICVYLFQCVFGSLASAAALTDAVFMAITLIVVRIGFSFYCGDKKVNRYLCDILSFIALTASRIILPSRYEIHYYDVVQYHNPSNLVVRPIAFIVFFLYVFIYSQYIKNDFKQKSVGIKPWLLLSLALFISVLAKPSFIQIFVGGAGLLLLIDLIALRGKNLRFLLNTVLSCVPAVALLFIQFILIFIMGKIGSGNSSGGIEFDFLRDLDLFRIKVIAVSYLFPAFVLITNIRHYYNKYAVKLSVCMFAAGALIANCIYETGYRATDGNFKWGRQLAMSVLWFVVLNEFIHFVFDKEARQSRWYYPKLIIGSMLLVLHTAGGIMYMYLLLSDPARWL